MVPSKARALVAAATQADKMEKETEQTTLAIKHNGSTRNGPKRQEDETQQETNNRPKKPTENRSYTFLHVQRAEITLYVSASFKKTYPHVLLVFINTKTVSI